MVDVNAHVTTSPHTVEPGETDWLFTQTFREDDNIEGHELTLTLSLTDRTNGDAHELDILETQINEEGVIGRAENQTDEFVDMVDVAVATYDDAGELLSITFSYIETLNLDKLSRSKPTLTTIHIA